MELDEIRNKIIQDDWLISDALEECAKEGFCPALINDDDGRWALSFSGFQDVVMGDEAIDMNTSFFIEKRFWKDNIREAVLYALADD